MESFAQQEHPKAVFLCSTWLEYGKFGHKLDKKEAFWDIGEQQRRDCQG
jgi:hypothetical protein